MSYNTLQLMPLALSLYVFNVKLVQRIKLKKKQIFIY